MAIGNSVVSTNMNGGAPGWILPSHSQQQQQQQLIQQQQPSQQPPIPGHQSSQPIVLTPIPALALANESTWLLMGAVAEQLSDLDRALAAYEHALRHNPMSISALTQVAGIARAKDDFVKAIEFFQRVLNISQDNGEIWGALGHCYLMMDDLQKAYTAYQQALYHLPNPKEPKLWYGIGILYDRYGSLEHAEEAFSSVLRMEQNFEKANEIYFRLGIIYKQQNKFSASLDCFRYILKSPPKPLTEIDIWFQLGHVHEQQKEYGLAKEAYERVLAENPDHSKVLQQLGWLYHQREASFANQELAISYLERSLNADRGDSQTWYLLGRVFMSEQRYNKAYEYYQQAVYRDGRSPTFWCSIGVLYYQINQFRDALDAYSRAIRLNPYISEVWFDLGSLYESCNNQIADAIDAYGRALDLDPTNETIKSRLSLLKNLQITGGPSPVPPPPQDVHPTAYNNAINQNSSEELRAGMGVIGGSGNGTSAPGGSRSGPVDLGPPPPSTLQSGSGRAESINDSHGHPTASGAPPSSSTSVFNPYYPTGPPGHLYRGPPSPPPPQGPSAHYRGPAGPAEDSRSSRSVGSAMDVDRPPPPSSGGGGRNLPNGRAPFDAARNSAAPSPLARHSDTYPASQAAYTNPYPPYIQPMTAGLMGVRHGYPTASAAGAGPSERALPSSTVEMEWERSREASAMHGGASGTTTGGGPGYYSGTGSHGGRRSPFDHRRRSDESTAASEDRGDRRGSGARSPFPSAYPPTAGYHHPPQQQQPPQHPFHSHPAGQERPRSPIIPLGSHDSQSAAAAAGSVVGASAGRRYDPTMDSSSNTISNSPNSVPKHRRSSVGKGSSRMAAEEELLSTSPAGGPSSSSAAAAVKESSGGGGSRKRKNGTQVGVKGEEKKARRSRNSTTSGGNSKADRAEKAERERGEKADRTGGGDDEGGEKAEKPEKGGRHDRTEKVDKAEKNGSSKAEKNGKKGGDGPSLKVTLNANSGNKSGKNSQSSTGRSASGPALAAAALRYVDDNYDDEDEGSNSDAVGAADLLMGLAGGFSFSSSQSQPPPPSSQLASLPLSSLSSPQAQPQVNGVSKSTVPSVPAPPLFPVPSVTSIHNLTSPSPSSIPVPSSTATSTLTPKTSSSQTQPTTTKMTTVTTIHVPTTKPGFSEEALKNLRSSRPTTPMDVVPGSKDFKLGAGSTTSTPSKRSSSLVNSQTPVAAASATNAPIDETITTPPTEISPKIESTEDKGLPSTDAFNGGSGQDKVGANGATNSSPSTSTRARSKEVDEPMRSASTGSSPTRVTSAPDSSSGTIPAEPTLSISKDVSMTSDHEKSPAAPAATSTPSSKPSSSSSNHLSRLLSPNPTPVSTTTAPPSTPASALDGSSKAMPDRTAVSPQRSPLPSMTVNSDSAMNGGEVKSTDDRKSSSPKTLGAANASASSPSPSKEKISPVVDGDKISESEPMAEKADGNKINTDVDVEMEDVKA